MAITVEHLFRDDTRGQTQQHGSATYFSRLVRRQDKV